MHALVTTTGLRVINTPPRARTSTCETWDGAALLYLARQLEVSSAARHTADPNTVLGFQKRTLGTEKRLAENSPKA